MNKVALVGRLTAKPELRYTSSNVAFTRFTLAVNRQYSDEDGKRDADFINIVSWRKQAELITKYFDDGKSVATNAYSLIGKIGLVTVAISKLNATGQVKVNGEVWSAKADGDIAQGTEVEVLKIDGVKLIVKPKIGAVQNASN